MRRFVTKMKSGAIKRKQTTDYFLFAVSLLTAVFFLSIITGPTNASAQAGLDDLVENGSFIVTRNGKILFEHNSTQLFVPASILKVLTNLAALQILGPQYRFSTRFYIDNKKNLYIHGEGDPFLVSEDILKITQQLKNKGINTIHSIILDDSSFALSSPVDGSSQSANPYDAVNGALVVNFNSLPILIHKIGTVLSGEAQTPMLNLMKEAGEGLQEGNYRINISSLPNRRKISLPLQYTGELFSAFFKQMGINVTNGFHQGRIQPQCRLIFTYLSDKNLQDLVRANLKFSNNFIANQFFLSCGIKQEGFPATWKKSQRVMKKFIQNNLDLGSDDLFVAEGSGLSRKNRISAASMIHILKHFKPYLNLLPLHKGIPVKTGTLADVFCYAGYFTNNGRYDPFVIMLNQQENNRESIFQILRKYYSEAPLEIEKQNEH